MKNYKTWLFHGVTLVAGILLPCARVAAQAAPAPVTLHVSLFPYLPDAAGDNLEGMRQRIVREFEAATPGVKLLLDPLDKNSEVFYDLHALESLLTTNSPTGQLDMVETDTLFLGDLIADGCIESWPTLPYAGDWHPAAQAAVNVGGDLWGVPHYLCTFFVYSRLSGIVQAKTADQFVNVLTTQGKAPVHFAGNFAGSFTLPAIYIDGYAEAYGPGSAATGLARPLDISVAQSLRVMTSAGVKDGKNPCLDGTYKDDKDIAAAVPAFARGEIDAFFGYSERLHYILKHSPRSSAYAVVPAPLGRGEPPVMYVDALVLRKGVTPLKRLAARAFATYINSPATQEWILLSGDAPNAQARYLLPATQSVFQNTGLRTNYYYHVLQMGITNGRPFPTSGYLERKDYFKTNLMSFLQSK